MNLYKTVALLILLFTCTLASARTDTHLVGHVTDARTKEHLAGISIALKGTTIGQITDGTGHFFLKDLPSGNFTVEFSCVGYQTTIREVTLEKGKTVELKVELHEELFTLNEVVVSSNRNETNKREASTIVNVISPLTIERTASNNMADVLNYQPGLRVEMSCSNCGVPQLRINGLEGQYTQILLDSRPIFSSLASVYGLEQLPTEMVQRVEVIRGGGSALFGSNAIGGVVNIITKEPLHNSVSVSNNTQWLNGKTHDMNTSINGSFVTDDFKSGIYLFGVIKDRGGYDHDNDGFTEMPTLNTQTIGFRGYHKTSDFSKLTLEYHHIHEYRRGGNKLDRPPHEADVAEQLEHSIHGGGAKFDIFSPDYKNRLNIYTSMQGIARKSYFGTNQNPDAYGRTSDFTFLAGTQFSHSFDWLGFMPADLTAGVEYTMNNLNDQMLGYHREIDQKIHTYGGYLQNEWKTARWSILVGARLDKHNLVKNPVLSPRATMRYSPTPEIGLRLSYSSGYRAPQAYDEDLHVAAVGGEVALIVLDPDLRPEYSHSINASIDYTKQFGNWETNFLAEGFYTNINDVFTLVENGHDQQGNLLLLRTNASGAVVAGVNFEVKAAYNNKFLLQGGYTIQSSQYKELHRWSEDEDLAPQKRMLRTPDFYGYISAGYNFSKQLNATLIGTHTGSMIVPHYAGYIEKDAEKTTPNFYDVTLRLAYDVKISKLVSFEISGGVKNMFNSFQSDFDKGVNRDAKYIYGPNLPRTPFIGGKLRF